jgi:hypothetical protein
MVWANTRPNIAATNNNTTVLWILSLYGSSAKSTSANLWEKTLYIIAIGTEKIMSVNELIIYIVTKIFNFQDSNV